MWTNGISRHLRTSDDVFTTATERVWRTNMSRVWSFFFCVFFLLLFVVFFFSFFFLLLKKNSVRNRHRVTVRRATRTTIFVRHVFFLFAACFMRRYVFILFAVTFCTVAVYCSIISKYTTRQIKNYYKIILLISLIVLFTWWLGGVLVIHFFFFFYIQPSLATFFFWFFKIRLGSTRYFQTHISGRDFE